MAVANQAKSANLSSPSAEAGDHSKPASAKGKIFKIRLLAGIHSDGKNIYNPGDVFESPTDLVERLGANKFAYAEKSPS